MHKIIAKAFTDSARINEEFLNRNRETILEVARLLVQTFQKGRKLLIFGNGGSAAEAQHLAAELVNRFRLNRKAMAALALSTDTSVLTSIGNDVSFEQVFARQVEAFGKVDDVALALSTSGRSPNVLAAVTAAHRAGMVAVGMTGGDGGEMARECDHCLVVPSTDTPRVQEAHLLAGHIICELVEQEMAR